MTRLLIPTLLTLACTAPAFAQAATLLHPGAEVRVTSPGARGRFAVDEVSPDTLTLRDPTGIVVRVPMTSVQKLSISRGRRSAGSAALRSAGIGFAFGAVTGATIGLVSGDDPPGGLITFSAGDKAMIAGVLLGGSGALLGGVIGLLAPGERWESVPLDDVRAGLSSDGGIALGLAIRF
jgi:hypothetical protein